MDEIKVFRQDHYISILKFWTPNERLLRLKWKASQSSWIIFNFDFKFNSNQIQNLYLIFNIGGFQLRIYLRLFLRWNLYPQLILSPHNAIINEKEANGFMNLTRKETTRSEKKEEKSHMRKKKHFQIPKESFNVVKNEELFLFLVLIREEGLRHNIEFSQLRKKEKNYGATWLKKECIVKKNQYLFE